MAAKWRIYYDNEITYSSGDGAAEDAPVDGVQMIIEWQDDKPDTKIVHMGMDYYLRVGDTWASCNQHDLERHLRIRPPKAHVILFGRWMDTNKYHLIRKQAHSDTCEGC